jgi:hypothetical protein
MPAVVAVVGAFASAGGAAAGFIQFASIAGAVLSGIGALTGKKDLMKIGAVLSIGGGIAGALSGLSAGAGAAAGAAEGAAGAAADMGTQSLGAAGMGAQAIEAAAAAGGATEAAAGVAGMSGMEGITSAGVIQDAATGATTTLPGAVEGATGAPTSLADMAAKAGGGEGVASEFTTAQTTQAPAGAAAAGSRIAEAAKGIQSNDLSSWWERAQAAGKTVSNFIEKNPTLVKMGGEMLQGMYGPQAEEFDYRKSLYERSMRNLNSPVKMAYTQPTTQGAKP